MPRPIKCNGYVSQRSTKQQRGCTPPTRFKYLPVTLGTCRPWHVTVGYGNPRYCFVVTLSLLLKRQRTPFQQAKQAGQQAVHQQIHGTGHAEHRQGVVGLAVDALGQAHNVHN